MTNEIPIAGFEIHEKEMGVKITKCPINQRINTT